MILKQAFKKGFAVLWSTLLLIPLLGVGTSTAALKDFGPTNPAVGYPVWYRDASSNITIPGLNLFQGLPLELCTSKTFSPTVAGGYMCNLLPEASNPGAGVPGFVPANPLVLPTNPFATPPNGNFPSEHFWWSAGALFNTGGIDANLVLGLEGAFAGIPVQNGTQISFGRVRIRINTAIAGDYRVTHPYGVKIFRNVPVGVKAINFTDDIGIGAPGNFSGALGSVIGPYLVWDTEFPVIVGTPPNQEYYIGDPNVNHTVTGSPFGTNFFRVERIDPNNNDAVLQTEQTNLFSVIGKIYTTPISTPMTVSRASYVRDSAQAKVNVFATANPNSNVPATPSSLSVSGANLTTTTMATDGAGNFFAQLSVAPNLLPGTVTVTNTADSPPTVLVASLVDEVKVTEAAYDPTAKTLSIKANSSDKLVVPTLTTGLGALTGGQVTFTNVLAPPAKVTVNSSAGGADTEMTTVNVPPPVASVTLAANTLSPQAPGPQVTFTATASGGTGNYEYKFWLNSGGIWSVVQDYSPAASWNWNTAGLAVGNYAISVYARNAGSTSNVEAFKVIGYQLVVAPPTPASNVTLTPNLLSPQNSGVTVNFTAAASGGIAPYEYQFWLRSGGVWSVVQNYSTSNSWSWNTSNGPVGPGTYVISVYARSAGSTSNVEAFRVINYVIQ